LKDAPKNDDDTNEAVYSRILAVVQSGTLAPGQRMPEPAIARSLGVSRERVRRALHRLAHEGWLELVPNKGACLPDMNEYNLVKLFEARTALEGAVVRMLADRPASVVLEEIDAHLEEERRAAELGDRPTQIALSRGFHEKLLELTGNQWLIGFFRQIATPTVAAYALHAPRPLPTCGGPHEHQAIADAIRQGDADAAERLMIAHIDEAVAHIRRFRRPQKETSIEEAFRPPDGGG
jgi:DNA-binding GntR family transcriptional regulator